MQTMNERCTIRVSVIAIEPYAHIAQAVEHFLGKEEVTGSNPVVGSNAISRFE